MQLGVGGQHHLETAIEEEPVDLVGADATTDAVRGLDDDGVHAGPVQGDRAREAGEAGPDHDDRRAHRWRSVPSASERVGCSKL